MRSVTPYEMFLMPKVTTLSQLRLDAGVTFDFNLFDDLATRCVKAIHDEHSTEFALIPEQRYFLGALTDGDSGGFHSRFAVGYHNIFKAGLTVPLSVERTQNVALRTLELLRSYLHDSVHHSTYCTFRRLIRQPLRAADCKQVMPEVYREQYGINFRNAQGQSYSSPKLTHKVPEAINLNLLMDGVGIEVVTSLLNRFCGSKQIAPRTEFERQVLNEVLLLINEDRPSAWGQDFYFEIVRPSRKFLLHWGGEPFRASIFRAMLDGELSDLKSYFSEKFGEDNAWEKVFRQPGFQL